MSKRKLFPSFIIAIMLIICNDNYTTIYCKWFLPGLASGDKRYCKYFWFCHWSENVEFQDCCFHCKHFHPTGGNIPGKRNNRIKKVNYHFIKNSRYKPNRYLLRRNYGKLEMDLIIISGYRYFNVFVLKDYPNLRN